MFQWDANNVAPFLFIFIFFLSKGYLMKEKTKHISIKIM